MNEELYNITGINFDIEEVELTVDHETMGGDTPDTAKVFYSSGTETQYFAKGFKFDYKSAVISGRLPRVYAGFAARMDSELVDLMPSVIKACGFALDTNEIGGC